MRRLGGLLLVLLCLGFGVAQAAKIDFPPLTGRVVDNAHLLDAGAVQLLTAELQDQEQKTGQQVVVATVKSLQGQTIEDYGYQLGRAWGIGQKDKDTGVILLVAPSEHKVRIEVGYGMEGTLTDAKSSDIINEVILPRFKAGQMRQGVLDGASAILSVLNGGEAVASANTAQLQPMPDQGPQPQVAPSGSVSGLGLLLLLIIVILLMRGGIWWLPFLGVQSWGSSGSSGGSLFSGGGGSFGGGGASGSW
jgi:uncharacterized protein